MKRLFILGMPGLYGGAGTELHAQINLWARAFPEISLNIIPTNDGYRREPLYQEMLDMGVHIHNSMDFSIMNSEDALINFCSDDFLRNLEQINRHTKRVMWVNCMTYLFRLEKLKAHKNLISHYLYQREQVRDEHKKELEHLGAEAKFITFKPYFMQDGWEFSVKNQQFTNIGRISRQDADKFSASTLHIYEYITSPKMKVGHFLGFGESAQQKIGRPYPWIKTYADQNVLPVKKFYDTIDFVVQPTDTMENLPRIGFEAMFAGKPLVVDNRGGWKHMIEHGYSGFLCDTPRDFIYWGTRLAFEPDLRERIAHNALQRARDMASLESSKESWEQVFESAFS